jgi:DNA-binding GntR family transcriptional regulator
VREALAWLLRVGIVTKERHKGVTVRSFSAAEVQQMYEMRGMLQR